MTRLRRGVAVVVAFTLWLWAAPAWADNIRDQEWHLSFLHIAEAQQVSQGEGVIVAVLDTGVNANQPELSGNVLPGYVEPGAKQKQQIFGQLNREVSAFFLRTIGDPDLPPLPPPLPDGTAEHIEETVIEPAKEARPQKKRQR